jgi:hypothetical protein
MTPLHGRSPQAPALGTHAEDLVIVTNFTIAGAARNAGSGLEKLARLGYASKGTVYGIIGALTAVEALHRRKHAADKNQAFAFVLHQPFGRLLMLVIAIGLTGYAVWRIISGFTDSDDRGNDLKALAVRAGSTIRGLVYGTLAISVARLAMGQHQNDSGGDAQTRHWTARALDLPWGRWAVGLAGAIVIGAGCYQIYKASQKRLSRQLPAVLSKNLDRICRFGIAARGAIFAVIGMSFITAAMRHNAGSAKGSSGAMRTISEQPFGRILLLLAALGLLAYGVYGFVNARYRKIRAT